MTRSTIRRRRNFLKSDGWSTFDKLGTDRQKGIAGPPVEKIARPDAALTDLVPPEQFTSGAMPLRAVIAQRRSRRKYTNAALTLEELSFLLWSCQGIERVMAPFRALRTAPSAAVATRSRPACS